MAPRQGKDGPKAPRQDKGGLNAPRQKDGPKAQDETRMGLMPNKTRIGLRPKTRKGWAYSPKQDKDEPCQCLMAMDHLTR